MRNQETEVVRMKDLKPGDEFIRLGKEYTVVNIDKGVLKFAYHNITSNNYQKVSANSNERVLKIIE